GQARSLNTLASPAGTRSPWWNRPYWQGPVSDLLRRFVDATRSTVGWRDAEDDTIVRRAQYLQIPVRPPAADVPAVPPAAPPSRPRSTATRPSGPRPHTSPRCPPRPPRPAS